MENLPAQSKSTGRIPYIVLAAILISSIILSIFTLVQPKRLPTSLGLKKGVGILKIFGPISYGSQRFGVPIDGIQLWIQQLKGLGENQNVLGVVIQINSPGGTAGSSSELYTAIRAFKKKHPEKPVVVSIGDVGASGAYWAAVASDKIYANAVSVVGSIGVLMSQFDFTRVPEKYGIGQRLYKSAPLKDFLSSWREPTKQETKIVQSLLDDIHAQFVDVVATARNLPKEDVKKLATGQVYSGNQAKSLQLIDEIGGLQAAIDYTGSQVGITGPVPIIRSRANNINQLFDLLGTFFSMDLSAFSTVQSAVPLLR